MKEINVKQVTEKSLIGSEFIKKKILIAPSHFLYNYSGVFLEKPLISFQQLMTEKWHVSSCKHHHSCNGSNVD